MDFRTFWSVPQYLPYIQPDLTDEMVAEAEDQIGFPLPKEYIELLKIQNGGSSRYSYMDGYLLAGIGPNYPSLTADIYPPDDPFYRVFPFNDIDGHQVICLDYRENESEPQITFLDTEVGDEEIIASSFREYLDILVLDTWDKDAVQSDLTFEAFITSISNILQREFEELWLQGYTMYRTIYNESWIWIIHNKVPKAYIPENDPRYEELKHLVGGTALRYPEIAENYYFIVADDEANRKEIRQKLAEHAIYAAPLDELIPS